MRSPAIPRAVAFLDQIARQGPSTVSDLSDRIGVARSSGSDLASSLEAEQFLRRQSDGRFVLGPLLSQAAAGMTSGVPIADDFLSACETVRPLDGVTVTFDSLYCGEVLCVAVRHGRSPLPLTPRAGRRLSLVNSDPGLALLRALSDDELREHLIAFAGMLRMTPGEIDELMITHASERTPRGTPGLSARRSERGVETSASVIASGRLLGVVTATEPSARPSVDSSLMDGIDELANSIAVGAEAFLLGPR